jgi:plastocyanin
MKRLFVVALFLLLAACAPQDTTEKEDGVMNQGDVSVNIRPQQGVALVEITAEGFVPSELTVKQGETVTWVNKNTKAHWVASAQHPTHKIYPGSGIEKCGTGEAIFDACRGLAQGESFSFTFNEKGSWNYHDHLNVGQPFFGKIIVE